MKPRLIAATATLALLLVVLAPLAGVVFGEYGRARGTTKVEGGEFERAVDLDRFRKGNIDWDTQELIHSGMTALHREHMAILEELAEIKEAVRRLDRK